MDAWHAELHRSRALLADRNATFSSSGFKEAAYTVTVHDKGFSAIRRTWQIREILTPKDLHLEGKKQRHQRSGTTPSDVH
jgi:hypothetical protein